MIVRTELSVVCDRNLVIPGNQRPDSTETEAPVALSTGGPDSQTVIIHIV